MKEETEQIGDATLVGSPPNMPLKVGKFFTTQAIKKFNFNNRLNDKTIKKFLGATFSDSTMSSPKINKSNSLDQSKKKDKT